jgi:hypothetical protein
MTTRIDIINLALIDIGAQAVMSEDGPPGDSYARQFDLHVGALASSYPWSFQTRLAQLSRLTAPPEAHWAYMYELPSDMAGSPRAVYPTPERRRPTTDYEIRGNRLFTDHPDIWLRYTHGLEPARWPGYFTALAALVMKAQFALSVREDSALWKALTLEAFGAPAQMGEGGKVGEARAIDSGGQPSGVIAIGSNPLVAVRLT